MYISALSLTFGLDGVQGPVSTNAENLLPTGIQSPDRPARSESLHRLRFPAHRFRMVAPNICGSSLWNLLYVSVPGPRMWGCH